MTVGNWDDWWTGLAAVLVAFLSMIATLGAAWFGLKAKGITPQEAAKATERAGFRREVNESVALAVDIAHQAQQDAEEARAEAKACHAEATTLRAENTSLRSRVSDLELQVKRVPVLEAHVDKLQLQVSYYKDVIKAYKKVGGTALRNIIITPPSRKHTGRRIASRRKTKP